MAEQAKLKISKLEEPVETGRQRMCLKIILTPALAFLQPNDYLNSVPLVCRQWNHLALMPSSWQLHAKKKWARWRNSELSDFAFMFRPGNTEEELDAMEKRTGFRLRIDVRQLLKECSGVNLPANLFPLSFHPAICLLRASAWKCFDQFCSEELGNHRALLYGDFFSPRDKHVIVGRNVGAAYFMLVLLNTRTYEVVTLTDDLAAENIYGPQFSPAGSFHAWFDGGARWEAAPAEAALLRRAGPRQAQLLHGALRGLVRQYRFCALFLGDGGAGEREWAARHEAACERALLRLAPHPPPLAALALKTHRARQRLLKTRVPF